MLGKKRKLNSTESSKRHTRPSVVSVDSTALTYSCLKYERFFHYYTCTGVQVEKAGFVTQRTEVSRVVDKKHSLVYTNTREKVSLVPCDEQTDANSADSFDCDIDMLIDDNALRVGLSAAAQKYTTLGEPLETAFLHNHRRNIMDSIRNVSEATKYVHDCVINNEFGEAVDPDRPRQLLSGNFALLVLSNSILSELISVYLVPVPELRRTRVQFFWCVRETKVPYSPFVAKWMLDNYRQRFPQTESELKENSNLDSLGSTQPTVGLHSFALQNAQDEIDRIIEERDNNSRNDIAESDEETTAPALFSDSPRRPTISARWSNLRPSLAERFSEGFNFETWLDSMDSAARARKNKIASIEALRIEDGAVNPEIVNLSRRTYIASDPDQKLHQECFVDDTLLLSTSYKTYCKRHNLKHPNEDVFKRSVRHPTVSCNEMFSFDFCVHDLLQYCEINGITSSNERDDNQRSEDETLQFRCLFGNTDMKLLDDDIQFAMQSGGAVVFPTSRSNRQDGAFDFNSSRPRVAKENYYSLEARCQDAKVQLLLAALLHKVAVLETQSIEPSMLESPMFDLDEVSKNRAACQVEDAVGLSQQQTSLLKWIKQREDAIICKKIRHSLTYIAVATTGWVYDCGTAELVRITQPDSEILMPARKRRRKTRKIRKKHTVSDFGTKTSAKTPNTTSPIDREIETHSVGEKPASNKLHVNNGPLFRVETFNRDAEAKVEPFLFLWNGSNRRQYRATENQFTTLMVSGGAESGKRTALMCAVLEQLSASWTWTCHHDSETESESGQSVDTLFARRARLPTELNLALARMSPLHHLRMLWALHLQDKLIDDDDSNSDDYESGEINLERPDRASKVFLQMLEKIIISHNQNDRICVAKVCQQLWLSSKLLKIHRQSVCSVEKDTKKYEKQLIAEIEKAHHEEYWIESHRGTDSFVDSHLISRATLIVCPQTDVQRWLESAELFNTDPTKRHSVGKYENGECENLKNSNWRFVTKSEDGKPAHEPIDVAIFCIADIDDWQSFNVARFMLADIVIVTYECLETINKEEAFYLQPYLDSLRHIDLNAYCSETWKRCARQHTKLLLASQCMQFTKTESELRSMSVNQYKHYRSAQQVPLVTVRWQRVIVANYDQQCREAALLRRDLRQKVCENINNFVSSVQCVRKIFVSTEPLNAPAITNMIIPVSYDNCVRQIMAKPMLPTELEKKQYYWQHSFSERRDSNSFYFVTPEFLQCYTRQMQSNSVMRTHELHESMQHCRNERQTQYNVPNRYVGGETVHRVLCTQAAVDRVASVMISCQKQQGLRPTFTGRHKNVNLDDFFSDLGKSSLMDVYLGPLGHRSPSHLCLQETEFMNTNSAICGAQACATPVHIFFQIQNKQARIVRLLDRHDPVVNTEFVLGGMGYPASSFLTTRDLKQTYRTILMAVAHSSALAEPVVNSLTQLNVYQVAKRLSTSCRNSTDAPEHPIASTGGSAEILRRVDQQLFASNSEHDQQTQVETDMRLFSQVTAEPTYVLADQLERIDSREYDRAVHYDLPTQLVERLFLPSVFGDCNRTDLLTGAMTCHSLHNAKLFDALLEILSNGSATTLGYQHARVCYIDKCLQTLCDISLNGSEHMWNSIMDITQDIDQAQQAEQQTVLQNAPLNDPVYFRAASQQLVGADEQLTQLPGSSQHDRLFRDGTCVNRKKFRDSFVRLLQTGLEQYLIESFGTEWYQHIFSASLRNSNEPQTENTPQNNYKQIDLEQTDELDNYLQTDDETEDETDDEETNESDVHHEDASLERNELNRLSQRSVVNDLPGAGATNSPTVPIEVAVSRQMDQNLEATKRYLLTEKNLLYELSCTRKLMISLVRLLDKTLCELQSVESLKMFPLIHRLKENLPPETDTQREFCERNAFYVQNYNVFCGDHSLKRLTNKEVLQSYKLHMIHSTQTLHPLIELLIHKSQLVGQKKDTISKELEEILQCDSAFSLNKQVGVCKTAVPIYLKNMIVKIGYEATWILNDLNFIRQQRKNSAACLPTLQRLARVDKDSLDCPICMDSLVEAPLVALYPCGHMCCESCHTECNSQTHLPTLNDGMQAIGIAEENVRCMVCRYFLQGPEKVVLTTLVEAITKIENSLETEVVQSEPILLQNATGQLGSISLDDEQSENFSDNDSSLDNPSERSDSQLTNSIDDVFGIPVSASNMFAWQTRQAKKHCFTKTESVLNVLQDIIMELGATVQCGAPVRRLVIVSNYEQQLEELDTAISRQYVNRQDVIVRVCSTNNGSIHEQKLAEDAWHYAKVPIVIYKIHMKAQENLINAACFTPIRCLQDVEHLLILEPPIVRLVDDRASHMLVAQLEQRLLSRFCNQFSRTATHVHRFVIENPQHQDGVQKTTNAVDTQIDKQWFEDTRWYQTE